MYSFKKYLKYLGICITPIVAHKIYADNNPAIERYNKETFKFEKIHTDCIFGPKNYEARLVYSFILKLHYLQYDYFKKK